MEGMCFETPKGTMTFRKEDHQALQPMYHFRIKKRQKVEWDLLELVREIQPRRDADPDPQQALSTALADGARPSPASRPCRSHPSSRRAT